MRWRNAAKCLGDSAGQYMMMVGGFKDGRGEFFDQESLNGRAIYVRFIFSNITPHSFRLEQAFSDDICAVTAVVTASRAGPGSRECGAPANPASLLPPGREPLALPGPASTAEER